MFRNAVTNDKLHDISVWSVKIRYYTKIIIKRVFTFAYNYWLFWPYFNDLFRNR
jgi:hypothetical protein